MFRQFFDKLTSNHTHESKIDSPKPFEQYIFNIFEHQTMLQEFLQDRDYNWNLDIPTRRLILRDRNNGDVICSGLVHVIGSENIIQNTWLWGWANKHINENREAVKEVEKACKKLASSPIFTSSTSFSIDDDELPLVLTIICVDMTKSNNWFICTYDGGRLYVAIDKLDQDISKPRTAALIHKTIEMATQMVSFIHKNAILHYIGEGKVLDNDVNIYQWNFEDGVLLIEFDEHNRIIESTMQTI